MSFKSGRAYIIRWETPPGVSVVVLALGAIVYGAFVEQPSSLAKSLWIIALALLALAEILAISRTRDRQDAAYLKQMRELDQIRQTADSKHEAIMRLLLAINDPVESLKKRSLRLSESLLAFVYDRLQHIPKRQQQVSGGNWPSIFSAQWEGGFFGQAWEEMKQLNEYQNETVNNYADRFGKQVVQIRDEFARHGLIDEQLDLKLPAIKVSDDIRLIADHIGELADKLDAPH
jgi:hypothetical protein